tara:strand:- start:28 stop:468 length:441 start_codon:yes stop_codon:yes gene_type:complete
MSKLPDIETNEDILSELRFSDKNNLGKKDIEKLIDTGFIKNPEYIVEVAGLIENIGIKETIKFLEKNKDKEFLSLIKEAPPYNEARRKYFLDLTAPLRSIQNMVEGIYTCPKCNGKKVKTIQKQTRSSDEPTTEFNSCVCGHNWPS